MPSPLRPTRCGNSVESGWRGRRSLVAVWRRHAAGPERLTTWARLDRDALAPGCRTQLAPVYIRQAPDAALPRFPRRLEPIPIDDGPHLSYAIQWFAFALMAVVFGG